jgi:hypothetical protein
MGKLQQFFFAVISISAVVATFFIFQPNSVETNQINPYVRIDPGNNTITKTRKVTLYLLGPKHTEKMKVSNSPDFSDAEWREYKTQLNWTLSYGRGLKNVYVKFANQQGENLGVYQDSITLSIPKSMNVDFKINDGEETTKKRYVNLSVDYSQGVEEIKISNSKDFAGSKWRSVSSNYFWTIGPKADKQTVYVKFRDANNKKEIRQDSITYNPPKYSLKEEQLVMTVAGDAYYYGKEGYLHPIDYTTGKTWFNNFSDVRVVSSKIVSQLAIRRPVCFKEGSWLVKFSGKSQVYAVEPGCQLRPIHSPTEANLLYGDNWSSRMITLASEQSFLYQIEDDWQSDPEDVDSDNDGVRAGIESDFGSSDSKQDSDNDGLSDYEEINFWFTDPTDPDTDSDGVKDGSEIINNQTPLGKGRLPGVPEGSYTYPVGSLVKDEGKYYYKKPDGNFYFVSDSTSDKTFTTNNFQERFAITPNFDLEIDPEGNLEKKSELIYKPKKRDAANRLQKL